MPMKVLALLRLCMSLLSVTPSAAGVAEIYVKIQIILNYLE